MRLFCGLGGHAVNPLLHVLFPEAGREPIVRHYDLERSWWPKAASGYRIGLMSDFHTPEGEPGERLLAAAVNAIEANPVDLLVLCGDFVNSLYSVGNLDAKRYAMWLSRLKARDGVFAVLGNHDIYFGKKTVRKILRKAGIPLLENRHRKIALPEGHFTLCGFRDRCRNRRKLRKALPKKSNSTPVIGITHNPDIFPRLPRRVKLLLAGHTHAGQIRLPGIGPLLNSCEHLPREANWGITREQGKTLVVTGGLGCSSLDIRFGCPPEIITLTLTHKET